VLPATRYDPRYTPPSLATLRRTWATLRCGLRSRLATHPPRGCRPEPRRADARSTASMFHPQTAWRSPVISGQN